MDPVTLATLRAANPWLERPEAAARIGARVPAGYVARDVPAAGRWPVEGKAHLVVGARQVGKSTWLWNRFARADTPPLLVNAEELSVRSWATSPARVLADLRNLLLPGMPIFLEEAQWLDEAGLLIKGLVDGGLPAPLYVTGSSSYHLHSRTRESLAGRAERVMLHPFGLNEVAMQVSDLPPLIRSARLRELALRLAVVGGYPEAWLSDNPKHVLARLVEAFVMRDASDLFQIQHLDAFRRLLLLVAGQTGSLINLSEWATHLAVSRETVSSYVDVLEESQILYRLRPFVGGRRAELTRRPKVYFADGGLRNLVIDRLTELEHRPDRGPVFETLVGGELRKHLSPLLPGQSMHYWRSKSGAEVDFVIAGSEGPVGVEVKAAALGRPKLSRSARSFIDAYQPPVFVVMNLALDETDRVGATEIRWRPPEALADVPGLIFGAG